MPAADAEEQAHYLVREPHLPPRTAELVRSALLAT